MEPTDLIAEANKLLAENQWTSGWGVESLAERLADALEAAEKRAEEAEREMHARELHHFEEEERAAGLAAVVEKVRNADAASSSWDHFGHLVMGILATAPSDALREHDTALIEGLADDWEALVQKEKPPKRGSLWLRDQARQRREEQP